MEGHDEESISLLENGQVLEGRSFGAAGTAMGELVFTTGMVRELLSDMAWTITFSLLASLVVALTVVPARAPPC